AFHAAPADPARYKTSARTFPSRSVSVSPALSRASVTEYGLHLQIFFKPEDAELTPVAGLLVAAKGQAAVERRAVEIDAPGADAVGDRASAGGVPGLDKTRQPERRVVGDLDRLILGVVADDRQHG